MTGDNLFVAAFSSERKAPWIFEVAQAQMPEKGGS
jgi:hypothetical protein